MNELINNPEHNNSAFSGINRNEFKARTGAYYWSPGFPYNAPISGNGTLASNRLFGVRMFWPTWQKWNGIGVNVTTAAPVGNDGRIGIYNSINGLPYRLLAQSDEFGVDSITLVTASISCVTPPGFFWVVIGSTHSTAATSTVNNAYCRHLGSADAATDAVSQLRWTYSYTSGSSLPTLIGSSYTVLTGNPYCLGLKAA